MAEQQGLPQSLKWPCYRVGLCPWPHPRRGRWPSPRRPRDSGGVRVPRACDIPGILWVCFSQTLPLWRPHGRGFRMSWGLVVPLDSSHAKRALLGPLTWPKPGPSGLAGVRWKGCSGCPQRCLEVYARLNQMSPPPQGAPASGHLEVTPRECHPRLRSHLARLWVLWRLYPQDGASAGPGPRGAEARCWPPSVQDASVEQGSWARRESPVGPGGP